ncbi:MAG TPA: hypothetical protein VM369_05285 [Candidatus Binatia bacterium]|nr:hypothetical protein [Candidatus Binatia bacterium]
MTAVATLVIAFRRPEQTRLVLEQVRAAGVRRLFIALDAPREGHAAEVQGAAAVRALAQGEAWAPQVEVNVADRNLGAGQRPLSAISWFFDHVEEGVILEDDCVPHPSLFPFCAEVLARYRNDERVMTVSGSNFAVAAGSRAPDAPWHPYSYGFTQVQHTWGWATWRRAWRLHDPLMGTWPDARRLGVMRALFREPDWREYWTRKMDGMHSGRPDAWDYAWYYTCMAQRGLCVMPAVNLVTNVGDDPAASHTGQHQRGRKAANPFLRLPTAAMAMPLTHPPIVWADLEYERRLRRHLHPSWWRRRYEKLQRLLR